MNWNVIWTLPTTLVVASLSTSVAESAEKASKQKNPKSSVENAKVENVYSRFKQQEQLSVSFVQKTFKAVRKREVERSGRAYFMKPNQFRWIFEKPYAEELIYDGATLWRYFPEDKQANRFDSASGAVDEIQSIVEMVLDVRKLKERYDVQEVIDQKDSSTEIVFGPRNSSSELTKLTVGVNGVGFVSKVIMEYANGNRTTVDFSNHIRAFDVSLLKFTPPEGVKVTKLR